MKSTIRVGIIGLDTSHSIEYARILTSNHSVGTSNFPLIIVGCLRFPSAFQSESGQDERQQQLQGWGIPIFNSLEDMAAAVDGFMLEINDPSLHLHWAKEAVRFGKPLFIDKPLADNPRTAQNILALCHSHHIPMMSSSPLRYSSDLAKARSRINKPKHVMVYGPYNRAPTGSSIVWYGVNTAEMLNQILGSGATSVTAHEGAQGITITVDYPDERNGIIELANKQWIYGGLIRNNIEATSFSVDVSHGLHDPFSGQLSAICQFFTEGVPPFPATDALEVVSILDAAERSIAEHRAIAIGKANN